MGKMAKNKPNIQFPKSFVVPQGTFENEDSERVRKQKSLVPLLRALAGPEEDVLTQVVNTEAVLKIYSPTKLMHIVEGVRYGKAEDGTEHLFIGKMEAEKVVNELKGKQFADIIWPLWLAFVASKDDLPDNLSELEKPKAVAIPDLYERFEEGLKGFTKIWGELLEFKALFGKEEFVSVLETLYTKSGSSYMKDTEQLLEGIRSIYPEERSTSGSKTESAQASRSQGVQKPGRKPDDENISAPAVTNGSEDLEREKTAKTETKEFDPRDLEKGERGKLIGIALSGQRSGIEVRKIIACMGKTKAPCPSATYETFKDWYREKPKSFFNFLFRLRKEGKEWEEVTGQRIPDRYYEKYL